MGVQLNIKDPETVRLARDLAEVTGRSITDAVRAALEGAFAEQVEDKRVRKAEIMNAARSVRELLPTDIRATSSRKLMDAIYDEEGLPR